MMESIWAERCASGRTPRSAAEIDAKIEAMRNEAEQEARAVEHMQGACASAREQAQKPSE
jgi:hypothetical protein